MEKKANKKACCAPWNPSDPIQEVYNHLGDCFVKFIIAQPPFSREQMIDKALMAVQETCLFKTVVLEWMAFDPINQTWPEFKEHFGKAYENHIASGAETDGNNNYYGAENTNDTDDDSL